MLFVAICIREVGEMGKGWEMVGQHDGYGIGIVQWAWDGTACRACHGHNAVGLCWGQHKGHAEDADRLQWWQAQEAADGLREAQKQTGREDTWQGWTPGTIRAMVLLRHPWPITTGSCKIPFPQMGEQALVSVPCPLLCF